jgi:hypothetical protein
MDRRGEEAMTEGQQRRFGIVDRSADRWIVRIGAEYIQSRSHDFPSRLACRRAHF